MSKIMQTVIAVSLALLSFAKPAVSDDQLEGWWRIISFYAEDVDTKNQIYPYGQRPIGYMYVGTDGKFNAWLISGWPRSSSTTKNPPPLSVWEDVAYSLPQFDYRGIIYFGRFRPDNGKLRVQIEKVLYEGCAASHPLTAVWNEKTTDDVRSMRLLPDAQGEDTLRIDTSILTRPSAPHYKRLIGVSVWVRSHEYYTSLE